MTRSYNKFFRDSQSVKFGNGSHIIYRNDDYPSRTKKSYKDDLDAALRQRTKKKNHKGVKGNSVLSRLRFYVVVLCTNIDVMHSVLLGIIKLLFFYWFSAPASRSYSLRHLLDELNERLLACKPPDFVAQIFVAT
jgi:hypothetical protein